MEENRKNNYNKLIRRCFALAKEDKYIEAVVLLGALVESQMLDLINYYEGKIDKGIKISGVDFTISKYNPKKGRKTLGQLKDNLLIFLNDKKIDKHLESFINMRNNCVHKLRDEHLDDLDKKIHENFKNFTSISSVLFKVEIRLIEADKTKLNKKLIKLKKKQIKIDGELAKVTATEEAIRRLEKPGVVSVTLNETNGKYEIIENN